jgi:hypothetical protein
MNVFDINTLDSRQWMDAGATLTLRHPVSDEPLDGVTITLLGVESTLGEKLMRDAQRRRLKKDFQYKPTPEELESDTLRLLGALTKSWTNIGKAGELIECTADNAAQLYKDRPWIKKQVDEFVADLGNYQGN